MESGKPDELLLNRTYTLCQQTDLVMPLTFFGRCTVAVDSRAAGAIKKTATGRRDHKEQVATRHEANLAKTADGMESSPPRRRSRLNLETA